MFVKGIVIAIDTESPRVKLKLPDYDNFETGWIFVPQLCTVKDKSHNQIAINTLVGACCTENLQDGCVIGALYNDEDICILSDENIKYIFFEDGTELKYDKSEHNLTINCKGKVFLNAVQTHFKTPLNITGDVIINGNITSTQEITDLTGSMTAIRNLYNSHTHSNGNNGADTSAPNQQF